MAEIKKSLKEEIVLLLTEDIGKPEFKGLCTAQNIDVFASYCQRLLIEKDKQGKEKNPWMKLKTAEALSELFRRVSTEGLVFDGKHITLQNIGISYDYVAYKNKMLLAYPESKIDMDVVKEGDTFTAGKENGMVVYKHLIKDALQSADAKTITGAYCVLTNKRGSFLTVLSKEDIQKHKKVAKTSMIWDAWFKEMVLKTVLKKACKYHFDDIFEGMNEIDNEQIDLSHVTVLDDIEPSKVAEVIKNIEGYTVLAELQAYYKGLAPEFIKNDDVFEAYNAQKEICKPTK